MVDFRAVRLLSPLLALALLLGACDSGSGDDSPAPTPAPIDRIAFGARAADGAHGLYIVAPDGSALELVSPEEGFVSFPLFSPAGDRIAYISGDETGELRVYDLTTRAATTVAPSALVDPDGAAFSWSPDGKRLVFTGGGGQLRIVNVETSELSDLPRIDGTVPAWSPDGDAIAFLAQDGESTALQLIDADGSNQRRLLDGEGGVLGIAWSPDGERLAAWSLDAEPGAAPSLFVVEPDSGEVVELGLGADVDWSPSGDRIAYSAVGADPETDLDIYVGSAAQPGAPLTESVTIDRWPSWSPFGDGLAYVAEADQETAFLCIARLDPPERDCLDLGDLLPGAPDWR